MTEKIREAYIAYRESVAGVAHYSSYEAGYQACASELRAELEAAKKDAERYRYLKGDGKCMSVDSFQGNYRVVDTSANLVVTDWFDSFDAAIDQAIKEKP